MSIDIGAMITGIAQQQYGYTDGDPPTAKTAYIRNVTMQAIGLPGGLAPVFTLVVNDATQWDQLQVGQTVTVSITVPP